LQPWQGPNHYVCQKSADGWDAPPGDVLHLFYFVLGDVWFAVHAPPRANRLWAEEHGAVVFMSKECILQDGSHEWNYRDNSQWKSLGYFDTVSYD
jgi:hypothetical protein